jgi:outer membrane protein assembly factor BamB
MGMLFFVYAIPVLSLAFVAWAVATCRFSGGVRRVMMVLTILIACGAWALFQTGGITNDLSTDFLWRWAETPEDRLLAQTGDEEMALPPALVEAGTEADWPGFRGPDRDGIIRGVRIGTDWSASPPDELWRRPIGPGWSSFAVSGGLIYTQEQRGEDEVVSCYALTTGDTVWRHSDAARFWESNSGAGPRGTPTLRGGRVYTFGGTGILNVLDAGNGDVVWSRNAASDTGTEVPIWGFAGSPLVVEDMVIVAAAGSLIAYDLTSGEPRWSNSAGGDCYSSPHLLQIDGIAQVLLLTDAGATSVAPADGELLWEHPWPGHPIVQPALIADGDILVSADERSGVRRIAVAFGSDGWTVEELWASVRLKPYFNDSVIHKGHAFGFDGPSLACIELQEGTRKWKGGRYGRGQFVLLADQDLLLVLSEKGDLALVEAVPGQFTELARFRALQGKTWNHPVMVGDMLLVRNSQEMAAFRLSLTAD